MMLDKAMSLSNVPIDSQFNCALVTWMFCYKAFYLKTEKKVYHKFI